MNLILQHKCYCCGEVIKPSRAAVEHIIPNALGGKLKDRTILCSDCNGELGRAVDAPFCKQMEFVVNRLGIKRERGDPPSIEARMVSSGDPIHLNWDGTTFGPKTRFTRTGSGLTVECDEKNISTAKQTLKRKFPNLRIGRVEPFETYGEFRFESDFGRPECYRAVTKIALNYFLHRSGSPKFVSDAISFMKHGGENVFVLLYYPIWDVLPQRPAEAITHVVAIRGDPIQKLLYAYVELFTAFRFMVFLSGTYDGEYVSDSYCFDLRLGQVVKMDARFYQSRSTIADIASSSAHIEALENQMQKLFAGKLQVKVS